MKKVKSFFYWLGVLAFYLVGYSVFGMIVGMLLKLPNTMFSGFVAWSVIICGLLFTADDETKEFIKKHVQK